MGESVDRASPRHPEPVGIRTEEAGQPTLSQPALPLEALRPLGKIPRTLVPASRLVRQADADPARRAAPRVVLKQTC